MICIAGEHEDHYDPDFCIYNDVVVLDLDGSVAIYGYPEEIFDDFLYDPATGNWKRLTDRKWRQFSICNDENKVFMKGPAFRGCCSLDAEPWKGESPEMPDFGDTFTFVKPEGAFSSELRLPRDARMASDERATSGLSS